MGAIPSRNMATWSFGLGVVRGGQRHEGIAGFLGSMGCFGGEKKKGRWPGELTE
jgi:hypothetical protein